MSDGGDAASGRGDAVDVEQALSALSALSALWQRRWPGCRPVGHELRSCAADRWVRFHSLPESKRYAETPDEHAEVLRRHHCLIADLRAAVARSDGELRIFTASWSERREPALREAALVAAMPVADHWLSFEYGADPAHRVWMHVWASRVAKSTSLAALLLMVAADQTADVIIADVGLEWLYHPYDGGADVIAPTLEVRNALRSTHEAWLSTLPSGL